MSNFTPLVTREYEFEGDAINISFSRLKRKDMLDAMPALARLTAAKAAEDETAQSDAMNEVLNGIVDVIPDYVKTFEGLNDTEGNPVLIDTVCSEFYFMKLILPIAVDMLTASSGKEGNA